MKFWPRECVRVSLWNPSKITHDHVLHNGYLQPVANELLFNFDRGGKAAEGNFVKINLKKKSHVKGYALRGQGLRKQVHLVQVFLCVNARLSHTSMCV